MQCVESFNVSPHVSCPHVSFQSGITGQHSWLGMNGEEYIHRSPNETTWTMVTNTELSCG